MTDSDRVLRAVTEDGAFRVIALRSTETARGVVEQQKAHGAAARVLAELVTATVLVRETMAPDHRVQGILAAPAGRDRLVADAWPNGDTRGLMQVGAGGGAGALGAGAQLTVMRTLRNGAIAQGVVEVPAKGGVGAALMEYMAASEQIVSVVAIAARLDGDRVTEAGGYLVQLLPDISGPTLASMTDRLEQLPDLDTLLARGDGAPDRLLALILDGVPHGRTGESPVRARCQCDEKRVLGSLATLPRDEVESIVASGEVLEIACDYCGQQYRIAPDQLRGLLEAN